MIKNVVFDIGNVLVTFHPQEHFLFLFDDEEESTRVCDEIFQHPAWELYDQGIYQMEDLEGIYREEYPNDWDKISYILKHWLELMELKEDTFSYMQELKAQGYHLYLLSNISQDSTDYLKQKMPFFALVEGEILSYKIKVNKPSPQIYQALIATYHLKTYETLFLDDNQKNIEQAQKMGIQALLFTSIAENKKAINTLLKGDSSC